MRTRWPVLLAIASTALLTLLSIGLRAPCLHGDVTLPLATGTGCYGDLDAMWSARGLSDHLFPYLTTLPATPGSPATIEYPVLLGTLMWLVSLPAHSYAGFLVASSIVMGACAIGITLILYSSVGHRAWLWAASPALVLYLSYNYDAAPALCTVAALALLKGRNPVQLSTRRLVWAATLLAVGGGLKLYPLLLLGPVCLWLLRGSPGEGQTPRATRITRAVLAGVVGGGGFAVINLPFAIANFSGWLEPFRFQAARAIDSSTMSIWYLVGQHVRLLSSGRRLMALATVATLVGIVAVMVAGWLQSRMKAYPLLGACLGLVTAYVLLNKVFSPQYIVWLLPLMLLYGVGVRWTLAYVLLDPVLYWSWFLAIFGGAVGNAAMASFWSRIQTAAVLVRFVLVGAIGVLAVLTGDPRSRAARWLGRRPGVPIEPEVERAERVQAGNGSGRD